LSEVNSQLASILKKKAVCGLFIPSFGLPGLLGYTTAASQGVVASGGSTPPKDVYLNTTPSFLNRITPGTLLHETLHNLTGLDDGKLAAFVGPPSDPAPGNRITLKLVEVGCAPR